jgi:hypothetical protein
VSPHNDHVRRLRVLIARGMASPQDELNLRLLLLSLYGRPGRMVALDNPDCQGEETGEGEDLPLLSEGTTSSPEVIDEEDKEGKIYPKND